MRRFGSIVGLVSLLVGSAGAQGTVWVRQFGTAQHDIATDVATDASGITYVGGYTGGTLPGQVSSGGDDAFVRRYDSNGAEVWTRQFGSAGQDVVMDVTIDVTGNLVVVGDTDRALPGQPWAGLTDVFVRCYNPNGAVMWTRQFGTSSYDHGYGVGTDGGSNIVVAGSTAGTLPGQASVGGTDVFLRRYDVNGTELWTRQFGTPDSDAAQTVGTDGSGNLYVAGGTYGTFPGQTSAGLIDAFIRRYSSNGVESWTRQFGSPDLDDVTGLAISGNVYVAGSTAGALPGQTSAGSDDAFAAAFDSGGNPGWTRQFGSADFDRGDGVTVDNAGNVYVTGWTDGVLPGGSSAGDTDAFVRRFAADGTPGWTHQFGTSSRDAALGVATDGARNVYVSGPTHGTLPGQTSAGFVDAYVIKNPQQNQQSCVNTAAPDGHEDGPVSGLVHGLEPSLPHPTPRTAVHELNCTVIVPAGL